MEAAVSPARQARSKHRHDLRTLTYVTLDQANGGIVRNLSHEGIGVQAVAALCPTQQVRVRSNCGVRGCAWKPEVRSLGRRRQASAAFDFWTCRRG